MSRIGLYLTTPKQREICVHILVWTEYDTSQNFPFRWKYLERWIYTILIHYIPRVHIVLRIHTWNKKKTLIKHTLTIVYAFTMICLSTLLVLCEGVHLSLVDSSQRTSNVDLCLYLAGSPRKQSEQTVEFTVISEAPPANTQRNKHVIITPKHRFDVIIACLLRCVCARSTLIRSNSNAYSTSIHWTTLLPEAVVSISNSNIPSRQWYANHTD